MPDLGCIHCPGIHVVTLTAFGIAFRHGLVGGDGAAPKSRRAGHALMMSAFSHKETIQLKFQHVEYEALKRMP